MYIDLEELARNSTEKDIEVGCDYVNVKLNRFLSGIDYKTVIECGSRDIVDLMVFSSMYGVDKSYAFECNPYAINLCKRNLRYSDANIELIEKAVYNKDQKIEFYSVDAVNENSNIGASSLLENEQINEPVTKIEVDATRLDTFMNERSIESVDALIMDLQESELIALEGLGDRIIDVDRILLEATMTHEGTYYNGGCTIEQIRDFLESKGFEYTASDHNYWQIKLQTILNESPELETPEFVHNYVSAVHETTMFDEHENYDWMLKEVKNGGHKFFCNFLFTKK